LIIEEENQEISLRRQCQLIGLSKASLYYKAKGESVENLAIMGLIDEIYTKWPFYGVRRIKVLVSKAGYKVNDKRVRRLMRKMGLETLYPKPKLSLAEAQNKVYPYLLKNLKIERVNQVWSTDITYVRLRQGFIYLVAIMDWYSRYVLAWEVSNTLDASFCISALERALRIAKPEIFNSDQGSQFTSKEFTKVLIEQGISISMDSRGRAFDNIFVERLWRSVKYEEVYISDYENMPVAISGLAKYFSLYNTLRPHQSLCYFTPESVYFGKVLLNS
jgi:putative transposase